MHNEMSPAAKTDPPSEDVFEDLFEAEGTGDQGALRRASEGGKAASGDAEFADHCNCLAHLSETLVCKEIPSSQTDLLSRSKDADWIFGPCNEGSSANVFFFEARLPKLELGGAFRFRLARTVLMDQPALCVVEYGVTIMGMSGGDSKVRIRFCTILRSKDRHGLLVTAKVHPPPGSWFKGHIQQVLREWATSRAERMLAQDPERPVQRTNVDLSFLSQLTKLGPLHDRLKDNILRAVVLLILFIFCACMQTFIKSSGTVEFVPVPREELDSQLEQILGKIQTVRNVEADVLKSMLQTLDIQFNET